MGKAIAKALLGVLLLLAAAGAAGYWYFGEDAAEDFVVGMLGEDVAAAVGLGGDAAAAPAGGAPAGGAGGGPPAVPVEASPVEVGTVVDEVTVAGTLRSNESAQISPEIAGLVSGIHFAEGELVDAGDLLFSLEDSIYRAELAEAEARLNLARRNNERAADLFGKGVGTERARDEARAELEIAEAAVGLARARLEKTRIHAPFAGIAGLRRVSAGEYVAPGQELVNLEDIEPVEADFRVAERFLPVVEPGQPVRVEVEAYPGRTFEGRVAAVDPRIDAEGRSLAVRAEIGNEDRLLRPGLFARVTLVADAREDAVLVPEQALVPRGDRSYVFKVVDGKATLTEVEVGRRREGRAEIVAGLEPGDVVVTAGQMKIQDGAAVSPVAADGDEGEDDDGVS